MRASAHDSPPPDATNGCSEITQPAVWKSGDNTLCRWVGWDGGVEVGGRDKREGRGINEHPEGTPPLSHRFHILHRKLQYKKSVQKSVGLARAAGLPMAGEEGGFVKDARKMDSKSPATTNSWRFRIGCRITQSYLRHLSSSAMHAHE